MTIFVIGLFYPTQYVNKTDALLCIKGLGLGLGLGLAIYG